ncbi:glycoside hydrolase 5 family protein [Jiangella endophytica]|uniref:glycoside hydrolase 5 family protein n=1 Tax=Jiangella endophytica TaxID=1623398 RepID=UPI000E34D278|nr:cellulase family glycosylhydrolase [Jiangella endophytica]
MTVPAFGVNYLPSQQWCHAWTEFDAGEIEADLAAIAELGADHIRIQLLWPLFQPFPGETSALMLRRLHHVLDIAGTFGLRVWVTVLNGFLSGFDFRPAWLRDVNLFTDPAAIAWAATFLDDVAVAVCDHPACAGIDIGNEPNVLAEKSRNHATAQQLDSWATEMLGAIRRSGLPAVVGADHKSWMVGGATFSPRFLAREPSITTVHAWPGFTGFLRAFGEHHPAAWSVGAYLSQVARAHQDEPGNVWVQEIGVATTWLDTISQAEATERLLRSTAASPGVSAITWWASHDVARSHEGFDELEYDLGLLDVDNRPKDCGRRFAETVADLRSTHVPPRESEHAIALPAAGLADLRFARAWSEAWADDRPPRIVPASTRSTTVDAGMPADGAGR